MRRFDRLVDLESCIGEEIGLSDWVVIDQARIDAFAEATGDRQWIHVDPERAAKGPFGATIAHGFLTVSLIPMLTSQAMKIGDVKMGVNYGLNKVRFPAPVKVNSRVRGRFRLVSMEKLPSANGLQGFQLTIESTIECEGGPKPVCVAQTVSRRYC
jgi:acyl dehydratase